MNFNNACLKVIAVNKPQYPQPQLPEIAFVGRSNVGKSSLINTLINRKNLARTSGQPGKTRTINFYEIDEKLIFVDLPGYGYAKISKSEQEKWGEMIEGYLKDRETLVSIIMIVDIRHDPSKQDIQMYEWLNYFGHNTIVVCTKSDKISKSEAIRNIFKIKKLLNMSEDDKVIAFSAQTRQGKEELCKLIENNCNIS